MVDTNVFYNFLFETKLTNKATKIFELEEPFFTSFTVINETLYVITRKIAEKEFDAKSYRKFRELVSDKGYEPFKEDLTKFFDLLNDLYITVLRDYQNVAEIWKLMTNYRLLPNDALIAATCKHYGLKKIATFDKDFKRVEFLEVVEV
jgi:hypothetical protein